MEILEFLKASAIPFELREHAPVYTCEAAHALGLDLQGIETKNLFLRNAPGTRHLLATVPAALSVDLKALGAASGLGRLSFGSPGRLRQHLGIEAGSVSLLALHNDRQGAVAVIIDQSLRGQTLLCHPLVNTATVAIPWAGIERFLQLTGHPARYLSVPEKRN